MAARVATKLFPAALAGAAGYGYYNVTYKRSARQYEFEPGCAPDESLSPQPWINHVFKALLPTAVSEKAIGNFMLHCEDGSSIIPWTPPSRVEIQKKLRTVHYDVLVIGGGATGSGVALDATTRGLKTAMVEQDDFASGTSSRSTKLIHGGIRYLALAFQSKIPPSSLLDLIMHLHYDHSMMQVLNCIIPRNCADPQADGARLVRGACFGGVEWWVCHDGGWDCVVARAVWWLAEWRGGGRW
jgi:hypothetical protein